MIEDAIHREVTLRFLYKGEWREVEPHTYGQLESGEDGLCGWQQTGGSGAGYRLFLVDGLGDVSLGQQFSGARAGYHRGDQRFLRIYAEL